MNDRLNILRKELEKKGIPKERYSLGFDRNERICIVLDRGVWRVYFLERGTEDSAKEFSDFNEAKDYFWDLMMEIWPQF